MGNYSLKSPKNRYHGEIVFDRYIEGVGYVESYTSNDVESLKSLLQRNGSGNITIMENKAEYPNFDWQIIENYRYDK